METGNQPYYYFDQAHGELVFDEAQLPKNRANIILVLNRENLLYNEFTIKTKKKLKLMEVLTLQRNYIPFKTDFLNIVYQHRKKKRYYFWISPWPLEEENIVFDEVPESLIFRGDPKKVKNYNVFVFLRYTGFEVIYFNGEQFYSIFEKNEEELSRKVLLITRKFSPQGDIKILSEIDLPAIKEKYPMDYLPMDQKYFFLPAHFPLQKMFSNVSEDKYIKSIKGFMVLAQRYLNLFLALTVIFLLFNLGFWFFLGKNHQKLKLQYDKILLVDQQSRGLESRIDKIRNKITAYPDHLKYLKSLSDAMDDETYITEYVQLEDKVQVTVFSLNCMQFKDRLSANPDFKEIKITTPVQKDSQTQKETFVIEITYNQEPPHAG